MTKQPILRAAGLALLLSIAPAWAQNAGTGAVQPSAPSAPQQGRTGAVSPNTTSAGSPEATKPVGTAQASTGSAVKLNATDRMFVKQATLGGMTEVREGQLAQNQAQSAEVKAFGQHMVADHTAAGQKLKSIVDAEGIDTPADLDKAGEKQVAALQKQSGKAFDRHYVKDQLDAHKKTVALFRKEAASGADPQLKQFAKDTLPTLQHHLSDVEALPKN